MTVQEAIKMMKYRVETAISIAGKGINGNAYEDMYMAIEALEKLSVYEQIKWERDIAISQLEYIECGLGRKMDDIKEALEKQIPKKPTETYEIQDGTFYRIDFMCPSCNTSVVCQPYKPNFCKHCGQKIDWEEGGTSESV